MSDILLLVPCESATYLRDLDDVNKSERRGMGICRYQGLIVPFLVYCDASARIHKASSVMFVVSKLEYILRGVCDIGD